MSKITEDKFVYEPDLPKSKRIQPKPESLSTREETERNDGDQQSESSQQGQYIEVIKIEGLIFSRQSLKSFIFYVKALKDLSDSLFTQKYVFTIFNYCKKKN